MSDLSAWHPDLRPSDERTALTQFLDLYRDTIVAKVTGLDQEQANARVLPSTNLTVAGIVKHLAWTEDLWFQAKMLGRDLPEPWASAPLVTDPDWPFHSTGLDSIGAVVSLYSEACSRSQAAVARFDSLDSIASVGSFGKGPVNLRWILVHMIDETARHAGHLDLLRDAIDR
jgi:uncharacterized damage-inducible protein DinB